VLLHQSSWVLVLAIVTGAVAGCGTDATQPTTWGADGASDTVADAVADVDTASVDVDSSDGAPPNRCEFCMLPDRINCLTALCTRQKCASELSSPSGPPGEGGTPPVFRVYCKTATQPMNCGELSCEDGWTCLDKVRGHCYSEAIP
jgi:hypothetical protein